MESNSRIYSIYHEPTGSLFKLYEPNESSPPEIETHSDELHGDPWYRGFAAGFRFGFVCLVLWISVAILSSVLLVYQIAMKF
jgi:hypothetical protein